MAGERQARDGTRCSSRLALEDRRLLQQEIRHRIVNATGGIHQLRWRCGDDRRSGCSAEVQFRIKRPQRSRFLLRNHAGFMNEPFTRRVQAAAAFREASLVSQ
jgi:hypothetical protein